MKKYLIFCVVFSCVSAYSSSGSTGSPKSESPTMERNSTAGKANMPKMAAAYQQPGSSAAMQNSQNTQDSGGCALNLCCGLFACARSARRCAVSLCCLLNCSCNC